jgi:hypothetical protein
MVRPSLRVIVFLIGLISEFTILICFTLLNSRKYTFYNSRRSSWHVLFLKKRLIFTPFLVLFEFMAIFAATNSRYLAQSYPSAGSPSQGEPVSIIGL